METETSKYESKVPRGNAIQHYITLTRSPLLLSPIIEAFFKVVRPVDKNMLMGYLVLPVVLYPQSRDFLRNATARSSIRSFCADRSRLAGLPQRVAELRTTTSMAMQNAIDCNRLILHTNLSLAYAEQQNDPWT
ncbi:MAG: three component ABC system middle component [Burkholderiaceae bacterium]